MPDLNKAYLAYIKWRSHPVGKDDPKTPEEFCAKHGVTTQDLIAFVSRETYQDDLLLSSLNWAKSKTPELLHLVYNEVKLNKSVVDLDKFIQLAHEIKKKDKESKTVNNFNFFSEINDKQYKNIIAREASYIDGSSEEATPEFLPAA